MKPLDPRLLRYARATRVYLAASAVLGTCSALLVIGQAWVLASLISRAFQDGVGVRELSGLLVRLAMLTVLRAGVAWLTEVSAYRASAAVKSQLRGRLVAHAAALGPAWLTGQRTAELVTLATRGIDALDGYFSRYLPQLVLAVTVPVSVLAVMFSADWVSAVTILATLPLIPLFMALIGMATQRRVEREQRALTLLAGYFLDVVAGLPTLKVFGRARAQAESLRRITGDHRRATLRTLRLAFVSSFVLELLATISVALVAVGVGLRLVDGSLDLRTGLLVLILAPEAYLPLRQVGAHFHASADGVAAASKVFDVLETPVVPPQVSEGTGIAVRDLTVRFEGRSEAALSAFSMAVRPGECVAVVGASGAGKSTLLKVLLGFVTPASGSVMVGAADWEAWRSQVAWVPQHPYLFAGTVAENVRLARPAASDDEVWAALREAAAEDFVAGLPGGLHAVLGEDGAGLSAGQRQRIGLARAFLADRPVVLLDEPTANLDGAGEAAVVEGVRRLVRGRTAIVVAHRPALVGVADRVVRIGGPSGLGELNALSSIDSAGGLAELVQPRSSGHLAENRGPAHVFRASAEVPRRVDGGAIRLDESNAAAGGFGDSTGGGVPRCLANLESGAIELGGSLERGVPRRPLELHELGGSGERGALRRLLNLAASAKRRLILATFLGTAALASTIGLSGTAAWLISRASQHPPILYLMVAITAVRAFGLGRAAFRYAERLVAHDAAFRILADLRVRVYERLIGLGPAVFGRGDLLSRLVADVDSIQDFYLRFLLPAATAAVVGVGASVALGLILPAAGAALAFGLLITGVAVPWLTARTSRAAEKRIAPVKGRMSAEAVDLLRGAPDLISAGAIEAKLGDIGRADHALERAERSSAKAKGLGDSLTVLIVGATVWACAYAGIQAVQQHAMSGLLLAVIVLTPLAAFEATAGLPQAAQHLQRSRSAAARIFEVLDAEREVVEPAEPEARPDGPYLVKIKGLTVRRAGRGADVLSDISLDLRPGRSVAVVGPSGAGKTTLLNSLLRFLDPCAGSVTVNGTDTSRIDGDEVRRIIGLCAQDAHVFDSTVRENLRLAKPEAAESELREALGQARLLDWVDTLPDGLDTFVGEHGARLSGGQRQRLVLARAMLADFPVLLLDEPTEHLDITTADALTRDLLRLGGDRAADGRSTLLVTHRLAGLEGVDEIVVLDRSRIVERGTWAELQAGPSVFHSLWASERRDEELLPA